MQSVDRSQLDKDHFNSFAQGYAPYTDEDVKNITGKLANYILKKKSQKIAEIGCGSGQFSVELNNALGRNVCEMTGVDIAEVALSKYPFHRVLGSAFDLPIDSGTYDAVCFPASLHHLEPFHDALKEADRILTKGGLLYFLEPNLYHPHRYLFMRFGWLYRKIVKINDVPVDPRWLLEELKRMDYNVVQFEYVNLAFKDPGILQRVQNFISRKFGTNVLSFLIHPWFIVIAEKRMDNT